MPKAGDMRATPAVVASTRDIRAEGGSAGGASSLHRRGRAENIVRPNFRERADRHRGRFVARA